MLLRFAAFFVLAGSVFAQNDWDDPIQPHRIADNLYYTGTKGLSTYLITTAQGHILINPSFDRSVPLIRASVEKLGFKMGEIKILLTSHAHDDHVGGMASMKAITGGKVYIMSGDEGVVTSGGKGQYLYKGKFPACPVDRVLKDGEKVKLGDASLTAHLTPGHTKGCTTWTMQAKDKGKLYEVVIVGSPNANPGYQLVGNQQYPEISEDFAKCFRVLKALRCDIFLGAHGAYYDMTEKVARLGGKTNPFVDPEGYARYVADREAAYRKTLAEQSK